MAQPRDCQGNTDRDLQQHEREEPLWPQDRLCLTMRQEFGCMSFRYGLIPTSVLAISLVLAAATLASEQTSLTFSGETTLWHRSHSGQIHFADGKHLSRLWRPHFGND